MCTTIATAPSGCQRRLRHCIPVAQAHSCQNQKHSLTSERQSAQRQNRRRATHPSFSDPAATRSRPQRDARARHAGIAYRTLYAFMSALNEFDHVCRVRSRRPPSRWVCEPSIPLRPLGYSRRPRPGPPAPVPPPSLHGVGTKLLRAAQHPADGIGSAGACMAAGSARSGYLRAVRVPSGYLSTVPRRYPLRTVQVPAWNSCWALWPPNAHAG